MYNIMTPLKKARLRRQITLEQVSEVTGINTGSLSRYENMNQVPTPDRAAKLAEFFSPDINELHIFYPKRYMSSDAVQ